jgi:hypothetical protein
MVHGKSFERFAKSRAAKNSVGNTERMTRPAIYLSNSIGRSDTAEGGNGVLVLYLAAVRIAECGRESESQKGGYSGQYIVSRRMKRNRNAETVASWHDRRWYTMLLL